MTWLIHIADYEILVRYNGDIHDDITINHTQVQGCLKWHLLKYLTLYP